MRKALKILAAVAGAVSVLTTAALGCIYLGDIASNVKAYTTKLRRRIHEKKYIGEKYDDE